jgi:hypothetical protein
MGSAERCQAAGIPDATREVKLPKRASARGGETTKVEDFAQACAGIHDGKGRSGLTNAWDPEESPIV